ncbi:diaminopimelate epimerase [Blastococcus sp. TML/M2B]|uniref:diaminopimelate epimerase n=1 Tax=unclassified Blastococcus TaxID=2619396 RepID=UPI00190AE730|nr:MULTISPECIES: diaminopimelate epimerase [unclassified Blastococcus]MBN1093467.1 diaminopimelate epimerase [Blastococcus sp. TML/M2B]MBN1096416.1 diaminopimelate epimerase [Blastococcus sp. TML/C7B]
MTATPRVLLGHGTENDFVVLPDPDGTVWTGERLDAATVRRLCDRRAGLGGDGVLRLVRSAHVPDAPAVLGPDLDACEWFMDHRNADGSYAEMCGNGIRLFLHALVEEGLLDRAACADGVLVGTRGGPRRVGAATGGGYWVDMGPAREFGRGTAELDGRTFSGLAVSMGNPHLAALTEVDVDTLDLTGSPVFDAGLFPEGVNVELVNVLEPGAHIRLRVVERGVGETRSCGTGACAAAYTALAAAGRTEGTVVVDVPGGRLSVQIDPRTTVLTGPAVLVATGSLTEEWLGA